MMVSNSTKSTIPISHLKSLNTRKTTAYSDEQSASCLGTGEKICGGAKPVNGKMFIFSYDIVVILILEGN